MNTFSQLVNKCFYAVKWKTEFIKTVRNNTYDGMKFSDDTSKILLFSSKIEVLYIYLNKSKRKEIYYSIISKNNEDKEIISKENSNFLSFSGKNEKQDKNYRKYNGYNNYYLEDSNQNNTNNQNPLYQKDFEEIETGKNQENIDFKQVLLKSRENRINIRNQFNDEEHVVLHTILKFYSTNDIDIGVVENTNLNPDLHHNKKDLNTSFNNPNEIYSQSQNNLDKNLSSSFTDLTTKKREDKIKNIEDFFGISKEKEEQPNNFEFEINTERKIDKEVLSNTKAKVEEYLFNFGEDENNNKNNNSTNSNSGDVIKKESTSLFNQAS